MTLVEDPHEAPTKKTQRVPTAPLDWPKWVHVGLLAIGIACLCVVVYLTIRGI